ncbi:MAG: transcriptional repressor [Planctomycetales bacterium]|nr:transcriptional repressor [Planctomycetales bacterium]
MPTTPPDDFSLGTVQTSLSPLERFQEFLETRGKRLTQQRRTLVETVFRRHKHFEADELVEELSYGKGERVSRPTVYRALNEMVEAGLLRKMSVAGRSVYEHDYGYPQHDHLHCQKCQKLIEFRSEELQEIRDAVAARYGFRVTGHRMIVSGICRECRQTQRRRKRPVDLV